mmetsp:Transcript_81307/g.225918  ORF Transcript_81307/g.225918 Transcript_81307/m.225918 type:complete len:114 (+) Transcript_81307:226-567(+)
MNQFRWLGGQYEEWFNQTVGVNKTIKILNCGVVGGKRSVVLDVLAKVGRIYRDSGFAERRGERATFVDMAVINYVLYKDFSTRIVTGYPLHSEWLRVENRTDVDFSHKLWHGA